MSFFVTKPLEAAMLFGATLLAGCAGTHGDDFQPSPQPPTPTTQSSSYGNYTSGCAGFAALFGGCSSGSYTSYANSDYCASLYGYGPQYDACMGPSAGVATRSQKVAPPSDLAATGQPGIAVGGKAILSADAPRAGLSDRTVVLAAKPHVVGWSYQSFGAWDDLAHPAFGAASYGSVSVSSAVPTTGNAAFVGKLAGFYRSSTGVDSIATAELRVDADFSARSLNFASSGTALTADLKQVTRAPHLDLAGTLTYSAGAAAFTGGLRNAGGTMGGTTGGRFYGPAAQELGGTFTLKSATSIETFTGAYGAKR